MVGILSIFAGLFVFFIAGMMWAQRVGPRNPAAVRRRARMLVAVGWGILGLVLAVIAAVRGSSTYLVAGILLASVNAVFFWRLQRQEVG